MTDSMNNPQAFFIIKKEYEEQLVLRQDYLLDEVLPSLTNDGDYDDYMFFLDEANNIMKELKKFF